MKTLKLNEDFELVYEFKTDKLLSYLLIDIQKTTLNIIERILTKLNLCIYQEV